MQGIIVRQQKSSKLSLLGEEQRQKVKSAGSIRPLRTSPRVTCQMQRTETKRSFLPHAPQSVVV